LPQARFAQGQRRNHARYERAGAGQSFLQPRRLQYKLQVKDLRTGKVTSNIAERITSVAWANDNQTIIYGQEDATTKRSHKIFRHVLGSEQDELLYEETDELYNVYTGKTRSKGFIVVVSASSTTSEARYLSADRPGENLKLLLPRQENHEYYLDHLGDDFYIRTNDQGKNFRLVTARVSDPARANWKEVIPHRKDVMLTEVDCFATHFIALERANGIPQLTVHELASGKSHPIAFPEPVYVTYPAQNAEFDTSLYRISYESFVTPRSVYDYNVKTKILKLLKQQPVLGYDATQYKSERLYATASDGTKIPISIVYKKGLRRTGHAPLLLEGYGSYGISNDVDFASTRLSLLNRGVIYAIAHIRGGGELGKEWHDQGKLMVKRNTFTDFIASAEHLIKEKYTSADRLAIMGGSAGGLLMGAVTNLRPDLFKAVISYVPFVDVMNTMLDASLPLTVGEYLEWGNPNEKPAYDYMRSYSPYDNLEAKNYPTMLVRTSLNDSQVMYWEPAKYVAKLRTLKTDNNPLLFKIKLEPGGHGGASGRYDRWKDTAFDYAFILGQFGITK
jgi:oligopeptidase B